MSPLNQRPGGSHRAMPALFILTILFAAGAAAATWWFRHAKAQHSEGPPPDMIAVLRLNSEGAGYMDQYEYAQAEQKFRQVVDLAPRWIPGRINLAIAILNQPGPKLDEAVQILSDILKEEPENPYANYCLGIITEYRGEHAEALQYYERVTQIDPADAHAWHRAGNMMYQLSQKDEVNKSHLEAEAARCLLKARKLNPYSQGATFQLGMLMRQSDMNQARKLLDEGEALRNQFWYEPSGTKYSEMGHYAEVINPLLEGKKEITSSPMPVFRKSDQLKVELHKGSRWAAAADFGSGSVADLRRKIRDRFGGVQIVLDYNRDGKPDLLLLSAIVEDGKVRDLLLRNDGNGHFTDVTHEVGLATPRPSLGCCAADFDNDGYVDLIITGAGEQHLFRNTGKGKFEEISAVAGLEKLKSVCLGAAFLDLDQDGDLDLLLAQYAQTAEDALKQLNGTGQSSNGELVVYLNVGEAPPHRPNEDPPLKPGFRRAEGPASLIGKPAAMVEVAFADLDNDRDLDLLVLADGKAPEAVLNDRLLRFHREMLPADLTKAGRYNGALAIDADQDGRSDLFLLPTGEKPRLLLNRAEPKESGGALSFIEGETNAPPLVQAQTIDLDLDGWPDIVGLSTDHLPIVLQNHGGKLVQVPRPFEGMDSNTKTDGLSIVAADFDGDGYPDVMVWSEAKGLQLFASGKDQNHGLAIHLVGRRAVDPSTGGEQRRTNSDGIGTRVIAQTEGRLVYIENSTQSAGLGHSSMPLLLGLGRATGPDIVRFRWPDNVPSAEFNLQSGQVNAVEERNRKPGSCPVIFTWNGERFVYVTDFIGAGNLGEMQADGTCRQPRPEESIKIEADQLAVCDGHYLMKIAQPMQEVVYLDWLELFAVDHPPDTQVYPDERFSSGPPPSQDLLAFHQQIFPEWARDEKGSDVTQTLGRRDRNMVDGFDLRNWYGFAGDHWVELDFGSKLSGFKANDPLFLCTVGWTNYPYPESIWAAAQGGVPMQPPILERQGSEGKWSTIVADAGFPAGQPRLATLDVTGKLGGPSCKIRLRTNMQVFYDQIFVAPLEERVPAFAPGERGGVSPPVTRGAQATGLAGQPTPHTFRLTRLDLKHASLETRGCALEFTPDGKQPTLYDYDRLDTGPVAHLEGFITRTGEVTELLQAFDDRYVIFGPGEEIAVRFDATRLPALPAGWKRSFVLRAAGYTKDSGPFSATGATIEPLPFKAMTRYPYGPDEKYPTDERHQHYRRQYNTRYIGPDDDVRRSRIR